MARYEEVRASFINKSDTVYWLGAWRPVRAIFLRKGQARRADHMVIDVGLGPCALAPGVCLLRKIAWTPR